MKKYSLINSSVYLFLLFLGFIVGCSKDDGPIKKDTLEDLQNVPAITVTIDPSGSQSINLTDLASFQGKFKVAPYFPDAKLPDKIDVVVRKTNSNGTTVKVFKADVTTLPADFTATAADIAGLFGDITLGDVYDFSVDIYVSGKKFEAFPIGGIGTGSGPKAHPQYSEFARFGAICAYDPDIYEGNFEIIKDEWGDYSPGDIIPITRVSDNQFSFEYNDITAVPIIITVNTANNVTSVAKQVYTTNGYGAGYGPISCETVAGSPDNFVAPCDKVFSVKLHHTVAAGSFGDYVIEAKKVN